MGYEGEGSIMARGMPGFFNIDERLKDLSATGDDLERIKAVVDFEMFRLDLVVRLRHLHPPDTAPEQMSES